MNHILKKYRLLLILFILLLTVAGVGYFLFLTPEEAKIPLKGTFVILKNIS